MFDGIRRVFRFLRPVKTQQTLRPRKPMATPIPIATDHLALCELMMKRLEAAEAEVVSDITNPSTARQLLNEIHRLKRLTQSDLDSLRTSSANVHEPPLTPVRIVTTRTGAQLSVLNGGQAVLP